MKKVEEVRLMKEAAELDTHNILKTEGKVVLVVNTKPQLSLFDSTNQFDVVLIFNALSGRGKRRVNSLFSRSDDSPKVKVTPVREKFSRLRDIIDSDSSD